MDYQRDVFSEEAIMNMYHGIEQDIPEYVYHHSIYTEIVLKMMLEIRDIQNGYGQQEQAYSLLQRWITQCPLSFQQMAEDQAIHILDKMCVEYGCWKDIKHLCFRLSQNQEQRHLFFIKRALQLMNDYLYTGDPNVAKWIPREGSPQGQSFYDYLATDYVERYLEQPPPTSSIQQIRQLYKTVVKNKQNKQNKQKQKQQPQQQKTKWSIQEAESALIQRALLLSLTDPSMEEEDRLEQEWLDAIESYERIYNAVLLLDTPVSFQTTPENINRVKTICRFLYKMSFPGKKRVLITTAPEPLWLNLMGKTLVETIRAIAQYTEVNDNPTDKSQTKGVAFLIDAWKQCEIENPVEEMEKMTWIILSEFSQQSYSMIHSRMTSLFLPIPVIPHMVYVKTSTQNPVVTNKEKAITQPLLLCSVAIRTFWTVLHPERGISNNHWNQIAKITQNPFIRQFTPFQNTVNIVSENVSLTPTNIKAN